MAWFDRNPGGKSGPEEEERPAPEREIIGLVPSPPAAEEAPVHPSEGEVVAYLYKGSRVNGKLNFHGPAKIDGNVEGEIQCHETLTIGEGAEIRAKISGQAVVIRGRVDGDVTAKERVELVAPARLLGNIDTPRLIITEGVVFDGDCSMGKASEKGRIAGSQSASVENASGATTPKLNADSEK